ncbi:MAG: glucose-6-phosphate dehydrogenase [Verrucomicrobia bacterium]|nr:glucose-6-phosphate dehydrogenase [Verrucomicrobiota bacterium]MBS0637672.1 glucose-6-phosphate dehydrogenase [Verrucomicrobiota bacterium]
MIKPFTTSPLEETTAGKIADPCVLVIFGATGDLTARKLLPAIYNLKREGQLPSHFACVGFARRQKTHEQFRGEMYDAINKFSRVKPIDQNIWNSFSEQIFYHISEFDKDEGYEALKLFLQDIDNCFGTKGNRIFYLSVPPSNFELIVEKLGNHGLIYPTDNPQGKWSKVIIEKPFGHDLNSAYELQTNIGKYLKEEQIYRIDHWLGKETVQNLLVMRFGNAIFESVWNNRYIDSIQITVAEDLGVGTRGKFWEEAGMMRDIVQNHVMQLLSLVAMEPPVDIKADSIRDEKVKVLHSIRPIPLHNLDQHVIRGQYGPGFIGGEAVKGYRQEDNVAPASNVETYVAMQLFIDNWRWAGVPFYVRAGKRLPKKATEIAVVFKQAPGVLFNRSCQRDDANVLVIRIQPDEGIALRINSKVPGINNPIQPVRMDFRYGSYFGVEPPEAYERLIIDCILGDSTLFAREDEVMASWKLLSPIIHRWHETRPHDFPNYPAGSWGPQAAEQLMQKTARHWRFL